MNHIRTGNGDDERIRQRRKQIITAAVQLFSERGYFQTTVQDIADTAGISAGLIYQYFRDKEDLLLLAILDVLDSYTAEIPRAVEEIADPLDRCCMAFRAYCRVVDGRQASTILAYRSTKSLPYQQRQVIKNAERQTNQIIMGYIEACIESGLFRQVDSEIATYQLVMYAHAWALKQWQLARRMDLETYVNQGLDLFLHAMLTDAGWQHLHRN